MIEDSTIAHAPITACSKPIFLGIKNICFLLLIRGVAFLRKICGNRTGKYIRSSYSARKYDIIFDSHVDVHNYPSIHS